MFIYYSKDESFAKEKCFLLGFITLLFTIIYCVSFLKYKITGVVSIARLEEEVQKAKREVEEDRVAIVEVKERVIEVEERVKSNFEVKQLGDRAVWQSAYGGDWRSYLRLLDWKNSIEDARLSQILLTEIERVQNAYITDVIRLHIDRWGWICIPHAIPACSEGVENTEGFSAQNVLSHLAPNRHWKERARATSLLRNIKTASGKKEISKEELFGKLVDSMNSEKENSLLVAKLAFETFKDLTGFSSEGVFNFEAAINNWEQNKEEILKIEF